MIRILSTCVPIAGAPVLLYGLLLYDSIVTVVSLSVSDLNPKPDLSNACANQLAFFCFVFSFCFRTRTIQLCTCVKTWTKLFLAVVKSRTQTFFEATLTQLNILTSSYSYFFPPLFFTLFFSIQLFSEACCESNLVYAPCVQEKQEIGVQYL